MKFTGNCRAMYDKRWALLSKGVKYMLAPGKLRQSVLIDWVMFNVRDSVLKRGGGAAAAGRDEDEGEAIAGGISNHSFRISNPYDLFTLKNLALH